MHESRCVGCRAAAPRWVPEIAHESDELQQDGEIRAGKVYILYPQNIARWSVVTPQPCSVFRNLLAYSFSFLAFLHCIPYFMLAAGPMLDTTNSSDSNVYAQPWPMTLVIGSIAALAAAPRRQRKRLFAAVTVAGASG